MRFDICTLQLSNLEPFKNSAKTCKSKKFRDKILPYFIRMISLSAGLGFEPFKLIKQSCLGISPVSDELSAFNLLKVFFVNRI